MSFWNCALNPSVFKYVYQVLFTSFNNIIKFNF